MWFDYRDYMDIIVALLVIAGIYSGQANQKQAWWPRGLRQLPTKQPWS